MKNKLYRLFLLFSSIVSADTLSDYAKRITEIFKDFGIKVVDMEQGKIMPLAYTINGIKEGFQVVFQVEFAVESKIKNILINEIYKLIRQYCREDLLRSQFLTEDHKVFESINTKTTEEISKSN
jgi:ribosomal protein S6